MGKIYDLGIDVGSTTVKTVILDEGEFIYNKYERHFSKVRETVAEQLRTIRELYPEDKFRIAITGSAGLGIAEASGISFVQEVFSAFIAVNKKYPKADVVVELGGEDAKIIFLTGGVVRPLGVAGIQQPRQLLPKEVLRVRPAGQIQHSGRVRVLVGIAQQQDLKVWILGVSVGTDLGDVLRRVGLDIHRDDWFHGCLLS